MTKSKTPRRTPELAPRAAVLPRAEPAEPQGHAEAFRLMLDDCVRELLAGFGLEARTLERPPEEMGNAPCLAAFIGFGGDKLRGALTAVAPTRVLELTHPRGTAAEPLSEADAADWCCEFVNQLLGRFKNKLLRRGVKVQVSSPQGVLADHLRLAQSARGNLIVGVYHVQEFELLLCLDIALTTGEAVFDEPLDGEVTIPEEGDFMLF